VSIVLPRVSPQPHTGLAFEGFHYAREHGRGDAYNHRMFTAFFQDEEDIGDGDVLARLAAEVGLDAEDFRASLESRRYEGAQRQALRHAYQEAGITSVPTLVIGDRALAGLPRPDALARIIDEELARAGRS
jgi:predicted DsbA family dithiol-disulfide isomerase